MFNKCNQFVLIWSPDKLLNMHDCTGPKWEHFVLLLSFFRSFVSLSNVRQKDVVETNWTKYVAIANGMVLSCMLYRTKNRCSQFWRQWCRCVCVWGVRVVLVANKRGTRHAQCWRKRTENRKKERENGQANASTKFHHNSPLTSLNSFYQDFRLST